MTATVLVADDDHGIRTVLTQALGRAGYDVRTTSKPRAPKVDDFTNVARKLVLSLLPKETKKALADLEDKGAAKLDAIFAKNEAKLRPQVEAKLEEMRKAAEAAKGLELDLGDDLI